MSLKHKLAATSAACIALVSFAASPAVGHTVQRNHELRAWPTKATNASIKKRVGAYNWNKALRVARCETGTNWQHFPNGTYIGGLGMFRKTYGYGQRVTGYRWPSQGATKAEQIAVAVAAHPITYGWGGWRGCRNA